MKGMFTKFRTTDYQVKSLVTSEILYSCACDRRHGTDHYYLKTSNSSNIAIRLNFVLRQNENAVFKPFASFKFSSLLICRNTLSLHFERDGVHHLRNACEHAHQQLQDKNITFHTWCKPAKDKENNSFKITKENFALVEVENSSTLDLCKCPPLPKE